MGKAIVLIIVTQQTKNTTGNGKQSRNRKPLPCPKVRPGTKRETEREISPEIRRNEEDRKN
jgi:hypothetical protein